MHGKRACVSELSFGSVSLLNTGATQKMQLLDIEPYHWELYKDIKGMYLSVVINLRIVEYEKTIVLDDETILHYVRNGRDYIDGLAKRIETSLHRKDYERFYSYADVSVVQKKKMSEAYQFWVSN